MKEAQVATRERTEVALPSNATSLLQAITQAASNPQVDVDKVERLFKMHQEMVAKEAEAAFNAALARAQARIEPVVNNALNEHTRSSYAKLAAINRDITPIITAEGLAISFDAGDAPQGMQRIVAIVSHAAGHSRTYHLDLPLDDVGSQGKVNKTKVQATGSTNSYGRRYLVCMIFNVTTEDDDDGKGPRRQEVEPDAAGEKILKACGSMPSLEAAWKDKLTKEQRKTLIAVRDACKERILKAEQEAVT